MRGLCCVAAPNDGPVSYSLTFHKDGREWNRLPYKFSQDEFNFLKRCIERWEGQDHGEVCAMVEVHPVQVFRG